MIVSAEQLARIALEIFDAHASGPYNLSNPAVAWSLIRDRYPSVTGVSGPPSVDEIRRRYILDFWSTYSVPPVNHHRVPTIGPESEEAIEYNEGLRAAGITPEMMAPRRRLLAEVDMLRGNPMAALSFVTSTAMGRNREDALRVAAAVGGVWSIVSSAAPPAPVSDTTGLISHESGPSIVTTGTRPPDPYSAAEIRARIDQGFCGGAPH